MKFFSLITITCIAAATAFSQAPTLQSLKGSYVFTQQGNVQSNQSITGLGLMTFDGEGNVTCNETVQIPGSNVSSNCAGKYYVNADGSGLIEIAYDITYPSDSIVEINPQITTARFKFYVSKGGKQLKGIRTENGVFVIATFEKK